MKRLLLLIAPVLASLALPAGASGRIVELGAGATAVNPSCPEECQGAVRVTGLQGRAAGGRENPYYIRRSGMLVAFTVTLGRPSAQQIEFFADRFGSPPQVRLAVLRRGDTRRTRLNYGLVAQSENFALGRYFGSSPTFVLDEPLRVQRGNWVGVTVDTWAPMFAHDLTRQDWWRASRDRRSCDQPRTTQFAMETLGEVDVFGCTYRTARLLYTATYVPDNRPTSDG